MCLFILIIMQFIMINNYGIQYEHLKEIKFLSPAPPPLKHQFKLYEFGFTSPLPPPLPLQKKNNSHLIRYTFNRRKESNRLNDPIQQLREILNLKLYTKENF